LSGWNVYFPGKKEEAAFPSFYEQIPKKYNPFEIYGNTSRIPAKIFRKTFSKSKVFLKTGMIHSPV